MKPRTDRSVFRADTEVPWIGRYRVCYRIAQGGMASVYLARLEAASGFSKWVALKILHPHIAAEPRFVEMFLDEARIAARLDHPNLCTVFDFGEDDGRYYLAMEYLHGETLGQVARRAWSTQGALPCELGVRLVADAARGLHYAHELKADDGRSAHVVHRDVSPENIFVTYSGTAKVVDFGVARADDQLHERTTTGELKGKLAYMSPEQLHERRVDRRTDVWSLGVVLWEVTVGRRLFRRPTDAATVFAITRDPITLPSRLAADYPRDLEAIVMRALERDLTKRYPTAQELCRALESWLVTSGRTAGTTEVGEFMQALFADQIVWRDRFLRQAHLPFRDLVSAWQSLPLQSLAQKPEAHGIEHPSPQTPVDTLHSAPPDPPPKIPVLDDPDATTKTPEIPVGHKHTPRHMRRSSTPASRTLALPARPPSPTEGRSSQQSNVPERMPSTPLGSPHSLRETSPGVTPAPVERPSEVYTPLPRRRRWDVPLYLIGLMVLGGLFAHIAWFDKPTARRPAPPSTRTGGALPSPVPTTPDRPRTPPPHTPLPTTVPTGSAQLPSSHTNPTRMRSVSAEAPRDSQDRSSTAHQPVIPPEAPGAPPADMRRRHRREAPMAPPSAEDRSLPGLLRVTATTRAEVFIGNRSLGWTPLDGVALSPGVYSVRVVAPEHTEAREFIVTIRPHRTSSLHAIWHDEHSMPLAPSSTPRTPSP